MGPVPLGVILPDFSPREGSRWDAIAACSEPADMLMGVQLELVDKFANVPALPNACNSCLLATTNYASFCNHLVFPVGDLKLQFVISSR